MGAVESAEADLLGVVLRVVDPRPRLGAGPSPAWAALRSPGLLPAAGASSGFNKLPEVRRLIEDAEGQQEQGSLAVYRAEAAALAEPFDRIHQKINIVVELPKLSLARAQGDFAAFLEGAWRLLSGFEHGLGWAMLQGANRGAATEVPGGMGMVLSIKNEEFVLAAKRRPTRCWSMHADCSRPGIWSRPRGEPRLPTVRQHQARLPRPTRGSSTRTCQQSAAQHRRLFDHTAAAGAAAMQRRATHEEPPLQAQCTGYRSRNRERALSAAV